MKPRFLTQTSASLLLLAAGTPAGAQALKVTGLVQAGNQITSKKGTGRTSYFNAPACGAANPQETDQ